MNQERELLSIGQFASATGLSVSAVRFYTNRGVLHAADVDAQSGYRYFGVEQVTDGQLIRDLRQLEMPLAAIAEALEMSPSNRLELVRSHLDELTANLGRVHAIAQSLEAAALSPTNPHKDTNMTITGTPTDSTPISSSSATLNARALGGALRQVLPVASTNPETPHLMTVLLEARDGSLRIVATDRHRLAVRDLVPLSLGADFTVMIAAATAAAWPDRLDVDGDVTLDVTEAEVTISGGATLDATALPATYPDYQAVLDTPPGSTTITADPTRIATALANSDEAVTMRFAESGLVIDDDSLEIETAHVGPEQQVLLNPAYVRDALEATVGREVVIDIVDPLHPLVIRSADDGTFTTLVMPIAPE